MMHLPVTHGPVLMPHPTLPDLSQIPKRPTVLPWGGAWLGMHACALMLTLLFGLLPLDIWLQDPHYKAGSFVGAGNWWVEVFSHRWVKWMVLVSAVVVWLRVFTSPRWPADRSVNRRWLAVGIALVLAPASVATLKHFSTKPCPWDLTRYGGSIAETTIFPFTPVNAVGQCFPAGHASTGFALFAFVLLWRGRNPRMARWVWSLAFVAGLLLGWGQQLRGAHFLSHTLWSAWVCWAVCLLVDDTLGRFMPTSEARS
ncbi:phosphatase PAP2 family protein [Chitinimonas viridis]|uniref:phosphatase PAP2 family protein n=1 Tax=Chitinimonas viridis TaxID=664880 RepID=UPI003570A8FB